MQSVKPGPDIATLTTVAGVRIWVVDVDGTRGGMSGLPDAAPVARLADDARDAIGAYAARARWPAAFTIYQRGARADGVFLVVRGCVLLRSPVRVGRGFVPLIATPGETFGAEGLGVGLHYATDARAEEESETLFLSSVTLRAFIREHPQPAIALIAQLMAERAGILERLRELTALSVEQRIVAALVRLANAKTFTHASGRVMLGTQRYRLLCELVGATRESVSLVLGKLVAQGLAERAGTTVVFAHSSEIVRRFGVDSGEGATPFTPFTGHQDPSERPGQVVQ